MAEHRYDRRSFLARTGVLSAAAVTPLPLLSRRSQPDLGDLVDALRPALQELAHETIAALAVFVVPGDDRLSRLQRRHTEQPGALTARAHVMTMDTLDRYVPFPDRAYVPLSVAAMRRMGGIPGARLPRSARLLGGRQLALLDDALERLLTARNDATVPASTLVALLLNMEASMLFPRSLARTGAIAPFAKLRWPEKARVFKDLESPRPVLLGPLRAAAAGQRGRDDLVREVNRLLKFISGALLAVPALGAYSEYAVFDHRTQTTTARPLGWTLSDYLPGRMSAVEGHDELLGYYRGQR